MNGYSKMKVINTQKSRSIDFSDSLSFSQTPKATNSKPKESSQIKEPSADNTEPSPEKAEEDGNGERPGVVLTRSCSVSGFQSAVKRAFSMRRSSSVSERYCRIYDQSVTEASAFDDDEDGDGCGDAMKATRSTKKKHKGGKILKACKRLFGL